MSGCVCIDVVKVQGECYLCLKRRANLIGFGGDGDLTPEQLAFIGAVEGHVRPIPPPADPWQELLRGIDSDPVQPWDLTTPEHAGYGDPR